MVKRAILLATLVISGSAFAEANLIRVAIIDTGIAKEFKGNPFLCKDGHYDFTNQNPLDKEKFPLDTHGHGTHIAGLIHQYATGLLLEPKSKVLSLDKQLTRLVSKKVNYCIVVLKFYERNSTGEENLSRTIQALQRAVDLKVDFINYSGGGSEYSHEERQVIKKALNAGIKVVAAAGNDGCEYGKIRFYSKVFLQDGTIGQGPPVYCTYYPAQYDSRIVVVGNNDSNGKKVPSSNWGKEVTNWEVGQSAISLYPRNAKSKSQFEVSYETGTSQATAIKTGKLISKELSN